MGHYSQWLPNGTHGRRSDLYPDVSKLNNQLFYKLDYALMAFMLQSQDPYYSDSVLRSMTPNDIAFAFTQMFPAS